MPHEKTPLKPKNHILLRKTAFFLHKMKCEHLYLLRIVTELLVVLYELEFLLCSFEMCNNYVEPLLENLGLLNGHDLYHIKILKFYYKLVHTELPSYFNRFLPVFRNEKMHDHGYTLRPVV